MILRPIEKQTEVYKDIIAPNPAMYVGENFVDSDLEELLEQTGCSKDDLIVKRTIYYLSLIHI